MILAVELTEPQGYYTQTFSIEVNATLKSISVELGGVPVVFTLSTSKNSLVLTERPFLTTLNVFFQITKLSCFASRRMRTKSNQLYYFKNIILLKKCAKFESCIKIYIGDDL